MLRMQIIILKIIKKQIHAISHAGTEYRLMLDFRDGVAVSSSYLHKFKVIGASVCVLNKSGVKAQQVG